MPDRTIKCADCGADFTFTEREQDWYKEKNLSHDPRRCKGCRSSRKSGGGGGGGGGGGHSQDRGSHSGGYEGDHGGSSYADRGPRPSHRSKEMHSVACATCGKQTEVPFKPDPSRPVYCRDCYVARGKKR